MGLLVHIFYILINVSDGIILFPAYLFFFQAWVANFERPRMNANSLLASPTGLSPYLRFGCLSCRLFYFKLTDLYHKVNFKQFYCGLISVTLIGNSSYEHCGTFFSDYQGPHFHHKNN